MDSSELAPPTPRERRDRDHLVVLRGITWKQYVALNDAQGESAQPRLAYLDGELEIMAVSSFHEVVKKLFARLVETYAVETGLDLNGYGNTTWRDEAKNAGAEPDECYIIGDPKDVPDLVIEVVHTSGGINKLEIYRRLGVQEVWFWINGLIYVYQNSDSRFREVYESAIVRGIDLNLVARIIGATPEREQTAAIRAYRDSLRAHANDSK